MNYTAEAGSMYSSSGSNRKQLTTTRALFPQCSPDNKWVIFSAIEMSRENILMRVPFDGGEPVPLTDKTIRAGVISPDGKWIAGNYHEEVNAPWKIAVIPFDGGRLSNSNFR
jgi:Tol biopolymer transport system component